MNKYIILAIIILVALNSRAQECNPIIEINDDFESYAAGTGAPLPNCWTKKSSDNQHVIGIRNTANEAYSGSNYISVYTFFALNSTVYIVTPELNNIDGKHLANFYINANENNVKMTYGTMTDANDKSTFVPFSSEISISKVYERFSTDVVPSDTGVKFFAIKLKIPSWHTVVRIDDFVWEETNTDCVAPKNISLTDSTVSSLEVQWNASSNAKEYEIEYGLHGFEIGSGQWVRTSDTSSVLNSLEMDTLYDIYIRSLCDSNSVSQFSAPSTFRTAQGINVGTTNSKFESLLTIHPTLINSGFFTINNHSEHPETNMFIYQMDGQQLSQTRLYNRVVQVDVSGLKSGVYFIRIQHENQSTTKKIILQ